MPEVLIDWAKGLSGGGDGGGWMGVTAVVSRMKSVRLTRPAAASQKVRRRKMANMGGLGEGEGFEEMM
jgi:hypothetical protein